MQCFTPLNLQRPQQLMQQLVETTNNRCCKLGALTISESDDAARFEFDLPGFDLDEISIEIADGRLEVCAERTRSSSDDAGTQIYSERTSDRVRRVVQLNRHLDASTAEAALKDGVLSLTLSKRAESKPVRVAVRKSSDDS